MRKERKNSFGSESVKHNKKKKKKKMLEYTRTKKKCRGKNEKQISKIL